jgi:DNA-binding NtrC family response regulator
MSNASLLSVNAATGLDTNDLEQALLVDLEHELRDSRLLLLSSLQVAVHSVASYTEVFHLNDAISFSLVVLNICPGDERASDIAAYVRRRWPRAKVLLLGTGCGCVEVLLYDEIVEPCCNPAELVEVAQHLLGTVWSSSSVHCAS